MLSLGPTFRIRAPTVVLDNSVYYDANNFSLYCFDQSLQHVTLSSQASLKLQNKTLLSFYFLLLVMSIQMLEWRQVMSIQYLKLNAEFL